MNNIIDIENYQDNWILIHSYVNDSSSIQFYLEKNQLCIDVIQINSDGESIVTQIPNSYVRMLIKSLLKEIKIKETAIDIRKRLGWSELKNKRTIDEILDDLML